MATSDVEHAVDAGDRAVVILLHALHLGDLPVDHGERRGLREDRLIGRDRRVVLAGVGEIDRLLQLTLQLLGVDAGERAGRASGAGCEDEVHRRHRRAEAAHGHLAGRRREAGG